MPLAVFAGGFAATFGFAGGLSSSLDDSAFLAGMLPVTIKTTILVYRMLTLFPRGLTARISGFHPGGPGSTPGVGNHFDFCCAFSNRDEVAEWLRRWTANPMGSARVGSNPILVDNFLKIFLRTM